jgi:hypothetical protein
VEDFAANVLADARINKKFAKSDPAPARQPQGFRLLRHRRPVPVHRPRYENNKSRV